jgi:hypothetical protein
MVVIDASVLADALLVAGPARVRLALPGYGWQATTCRLRS